MKSTGQIAETHEVIMYTSFLDECTLRNRHNIVHVWSQSSGKDFGNKFGHGMDETNGSEICDFLGAIFLGDERNIG